MLLWAIFRQVPGHGPDGIDPPDFTEVINAGMKKSYVPLPTNLRTLDSRIVCCVTASLLQGAGRLRTLP